MDKTAEGDLACRIIELEHSLQAYRRLHTEELDELERHLMELKDEVLALHRAQQMGTEMEAEHDMSATTEEFASRGEAM
jgi:aspartyl/asparaginyl beta-hydroxylase (cupin superfamily)